MVLSSSSRTHAPLCFGLSKTDDGPNKSLEVLSLMAHFVESVKNFEFMWALDLPGPFITWEE